MIRVALTPAQHEDLRTRTRVLGIAARTRDCLEMIRLADVELPSPSSK